MGDVDFNHVGHCVADLDRARRFYTEALGFEVRDEIHPPDAGTGPLLRLEPPIGLTACYLRRDGFVLELLHYAEAGTRPRRDRVMNEPGLTHLSLTVDDLGGVLRSVAQLGGEVLDDTNVGAAVFVRDPDGQLVELLPRRGPR